MGDGGGTTRQGNHKGCPYKGRPRIKARRGVEMRRGVRG